MDTIDAVFILSLTVALASIVLLVLLALGYTLVPPLYSIVLCIISSVMGLIAIIFVRKGKKRLV